MKNMQKLAASVEAARKPVAADNPFLALQTQISDHITTVLNLYQAARDQLSEQLFFGFYGSPFVQAMLGLNDGSEVRPLPNTSLKERTVQKARSDAYAAKLQTGGFDEALIRAVLYVVGADRMFDQRCTSAVNAAREQFMHLSLAEFKTLVRDQFFVLQLEQKRAAEALTSLVPEEKARNELLKLVQMIVSADGSTNAIERDHLARLSQILETPMEKTLALVTSNRSAPSQSITRRR
jgi:hypothetical protein